MFTKQALRKLIIPIFLDQILIITVGIIATMMLSYAGEAAVAGVSLVDMINMLLINVLAALATGGAVVVSQYIGQKNRENACYAASQLIMITAVISIGIMLLVVFLHKPILKILFGNIEKEVMNTAIIYFIISGISYPFLALYNSGTVLFRSMGNSGIPMLVSVIMNSLNVAGNTVGIFWLHAGVRGVACSTLFARVVAALIIVLLCFNRKNDIYIELKEVFLWSGEMVKRILTLAVPNGIENGLVQLGRVLLIGMIALFGTEQITANGITNSLVMVAISFATAINLAIVTVVGQCMGAGDHSQAIYYTKKLLKLTYIVTAVISLAEILLLPWILSFYTLSAETHRLTYILVIIHNGFAVLMWPLSFTLSNALRAAGDVRFTMIAGIGSMFLFRLSFAYILGVVFNMGVIGIWIAMGIDWMFRSVVLLIRFRQGKWKKIKVV